jgi:hypothetical protein
MFTVIVKEVNVMAWHRGAKASAHFLGENFVSQALGLANLVVISGPGHHKGTALSWRSDFGPCFNDHWLGAVEPAFGQGQWGQGKGWVWQFFHIHSPWFS